MFKTFIDIETIPTQNPEVIAEIKGGVMPPATYKKPESIEEWLRENRDIVGDKLVAETSFNGGLGQIFCISFEIEGEEPVDLYRTDLLLESERDMLITFNETMRKQVDKTYNQPCFVGHNVANFDLKFLFHRFIVHGIRPAFINPWNDSPSKNTYFDTMLEWAGYKERISLVNLCKYLGIESPKDSIDGSMVWDYVKHGKYAEVSNYCSKDREAVKLVFHKLTSNMYADYGRSITK